MEDDEKVQQQKDRSDALDRAQWLRAAILGANDGLLSTTSLILGVGAAREEDRQAMVLSGLAGALAGALSMAVGEFVSISTQRDIEKEASLKPLKPQEELQITISNSTSLPPPPSPPHLKTPGRSPTLRVFAEDAARNSGSPMGIPGHNPKEEEKEEDDVDDRHLPSPYKAAAASAVTFLCGSLVPLASAAFVTEDELRIAMVVVTATVAMVVFGAVGAYLGRSSVGISAVRMLVGGWMAMGITFGLLKPFAKSK